VVLAAAVKLTVVADENLTVGSTFWLPAESLAPGQVEAHRKEATSARGLLTVVIAGVLGLFLLGGFLDHHYYPARIEKAAGFYDAGNELLREGRIGEAVEEFRAALSLTHSDP
jgi:hypothetical protein